MAKTIANERRTVNGGQLLAEALEAGYAALQQTIVARLTLLLAQAVRQLLGRDYHERRSSVAPGEEQAGYCQRCGTQQCCRFSRNGHRFRWLTTRWGSFRIGLPRVLCECGGSVRLPLDGLLRPYQRTTDAVDAQVQQWHELGLSLRQLQQAVAKSYVGPLALAPLLERVAQLPSPLEPAETDAPPEVPLIVQVDAVWVTQLRPTGRGCRDRRGRLQQVKGRVKRPVLLALGVWPAEDRAELLACQLADSEDEAAWLAFLSELEARGMRGEQGLELIIHDGGRGLCAALAVVHFDAAQQRCLFHKIRNIARTLVLPDDLSRPQKRQRRKAILQDFRAIWHAKDYETMLRRYLTVVRTYRHSQPAAVATLRRDFRATLTFYQLEADHPMWQRRHLRTTSRLERFNRRVRRRARLANAYHSDAGIMRMVVQEARLFGHQQAA